MEEQIVEDAGTRYEIHIQNEDGTSTGEVIVVYSNEGDDPAQVQELVSKALAQVAQQQGQETNIESMVIEDPNAQTEYYETTQIITEEEMKPQPEQIAIKIEEEEQQQHHIYITQEEAAPKQEQILHTLKPDQLELVMQQVDNEFTEKSVPYKLKPVEPEELEDMHRVLSRTRRSRLYGPAFPELEIPPIPGKDEGGSEDNNDAVLKVQSDEIADVASAEVSQVLESTAEEGIKTNPAVNTVSDDHGKEGVEEEVQKDAVGIEDSSANEADVITAPIVSIGCSYDGCDFSSEDVMVYFRHLRDEHDVATPFQCSTCSKCFKLELSLSIHLLSHMEIPALNLEVGSKSKKQYSCTECDFLSFNKRPLVRHLKEEHEIDTIFTCLKCKAVFLTAVELEAHTKTKVHDDNLWTSCSLCGVSTKNISQHLRRNHSDDKPFSCHECGYRCKFSGALKAHMLTHKSERAFKCDLCTYSARSKDQLKRHVIIHSTVKNHKCPRCKYATQTIYRLKKHMKVHSNVEKGYRCIMCDFVTHDKVILKQHKDDVHSKKVNMACKDCDLTFTSVQDLKVHALAVHKCSNSWFCKYCSHSCPTRRDLGIHMQTHVGRHRYVCKICGYSCRQSNPFKRHLARHNKVKSFVCTMCSYACTDKYDLEKHMITHSDVKMVSCPDCSYTCRYKAQLVRHKTLVHDEIKPYSCSLCNYTTKSPQNLKNHMHLHAMKKPHQCVLCDFSACQKSNLKRHMQTHLKKAQIVYVQS